MTGVQTSLGAGGRLEPTRIGTIRVETRAAARLTSDPVWSLVSRVPYAGRMLRTARALAVAADEVAATLPDVERVSEALSPRRLRPAGDRVDVDALVAAAAPLDRVRAAVARAERRVRRSPRELVPGAVRDARMDFLEQLASLHRTVTSAAVAVEVAPAMLGAEGTRRYFL